MKPSCTKPEAAKRISACCLSWLVAFLSLWLSVPGCGGPPPVSKANVKLVEQLRTAVAAKKTDWLDQAARQINQHRQSGTLAGAENEALQSIVDDARQGHWEEADRKMQWLIQGQ